jgi:hypothetical protein
MIFLAAVVLGAVAPLTAAAAIPYGTIQFTSIGGSESPPTDANGNGILDAGDYLTIEDTLQVTGSSVALVPVGTIASLDGILTIEDASVVRASLLLSLPVGSLRVFGSFSTAVFEGSGEAFDLAASGQSGIFSDARGQIEVSPGQTTTFSLTFWSSAAGGPAPCDPLLTACGSAPEPQDEPLLAPSSQEDDSPAVGRPRMPDLRGLVSATWDGTALRVRVQVLVTRPRLVQPFDVKIRGQNFTRTVRVRPRGRTSVLVKLSIPLSHAPTGRVTATIDSGDAVSEFRERNNAASAAIR